jgi:hypothetical protein
MKKNRPGTLISVLCADEITEALIDILFSETTTLGVRSYSVNRYSLERRIVPLTTPYGTVNVKFSKKGDKSTSYAPEYEDCRRLALQHHIPIQTIYRVAELAAEAYLNTGR